jgi:hypothetical protein
MGQVIFHLPLRDAEHPGQFVGGQAGAQQKSEDALARCAINTRHRPEYGTAVGRADAKPISLFDKGIEWQATALPASE